MPNWLGIAGSIGKGAKALFTSKWLYLIVAAAAISTGVYLYLKDDKKAAVSAAVQQSNTKANNAALNADVEVQRRTDERQRPLVILHEQTIKDYANARATLQAQPQAERDAPVPRVIIDTLNNLDRLRAARDPAPVPDAEVPKG